jgi:arylsulfatase A-like enzyme
MKLHALLSLVLVGAVAPAFAARHPVFSLVDNRPLAHLERRGGLYIQAGGPEMAKYVHFSRPLPVWKLLLKEDDRRVALAQAVVSIEVPLTAAEATSQVVHLGLKAPASTVKVTSNGKSSAAVPLKAGWQIVSVPLPEGALHAGENSIRFNFANFGTYAGQKAAAAVEFIQVGGTPPQAADGKWAGPDGINLGAGTAAAWYGYVPAGGGFSARGDAGSCKVSLRVTPHDGKPLEQDVKLDGGELDLSSLGGHFARIEVVAGGAGCQMARLQRADLLADGAAPARAAAKPPKNIILWVSDSTRADKFRVINPKTRVMTPAIDALAKRATVFRYAFVQGNESRVSHASLFTSLYPSVHGMIPEKAKLKPEFTILPEAIRPSGRFVAAVMGNGYISKFWGFGDGWDAFRNNIHEGGGLKGEDILMWGKKVLDQHGQKPFFLYLGTIDNHVSWRPHEPWISQYDPEPYNGPFVKGLLDPQLDKVLSGQLKLSDRDKTRIMATYDSDVSYTDAMVGQLMEDLKRRGILDDTMFILTADHGEEMWDHGKIGHGQSLHQELVHVPLVIAYPPYFPGGKVVEEGVDVLDLLPTITDALGVTTPEAAQGESLIPLAQGIGAGYPRPAIASQYELAHTMQLGRYKIWVGGSGDVHMYDAVHDLAEEKDLVTSRPIERRALTDALGLWMSQRNQWKKRRWGVASNLSPQFAADFEK